MRKRLMNISKRCMVAIMSAAFLMSSVTVSMVFPVGVYAGDNNQNIDWLNDNIGENTGYIGNVMNGISVQTNNGGIGDNFGTVVDNNHTDSYAYDIGSNMGTVVNNNGIINTSFNTVTNNYGTIEYNQGNIMNQYDGSVQSNNGTITNYFGGDISAPSLFGPSYVTNNFADITADTPAAAVNAANQFRSVTISNNNITAEYGDGFTEKVVDKAGNKKQFIQVTRDQQALEDVTGVITISPKTDYELSLSQEELPGFDTFRYELNIDYGKAYLTIYDPTQALTIDPTTLGLVISRIQKEENVVISQVEVNTSDNTDASSNGGDLSDTSGNVSALETLTDRNVNKLNANSNQKVFELDYSKQSNLTCDDFVKLCKTRSDAEKNCLLTCDGKLYVLHIPANIDTESDDFKTCLETFRANPYNGVAGPLTIATIFESFGITCTQLGEIAINDASEKLLEVEDKIAPSLVVAQNNLINQKNDLINQKNSLTKQLENTQKSLNEAITVRDKYQEKYKNATKSGKSEAPSRAQELSRNNAIGDGNGGYIAQGGHVQINGGKSNVTFTLAAPTSGVLSSANKYANSVGGTLLHCVTTSSPGVSFKTATVNFTVTGVYANDTIAVYQLQGKNWVQVLVSSVTDNHVTVSLTQHGPLAFVRVAAVATATH